MKFERVVKGDSGLARRWFSANKRVLMSKREMWLVEIMLRHTRLILQYRVDILWVFLTEDDVWMIFLEAIQVEGGLLKHTFKLERQRIAVGK